MAFEGLDDALADGQSQSCSLGEFVEFLETFEDHGLFLFGNAFTGIGHVNQDEVVIRAELVPDRDMPFGCELPCIVNEVRAYLCQP